jgi:hypothetical protein
MRDTRKPLLFVSSLLVTLAVLIAGCDRFGPSAGPVKLRDAQHMNEYLTGFGGSVAWELRGVGGVRQFWVFRSDGTFRTWIEADAGAASLGEIIGLAALPADVNEITGAWSATTDTLSLTALRSDAGATRPDTTVPLRWIDGKLRIGIAGQTYMRAQGMDLPEDPG